MGRCEKSADIPNSIQESLLLESFAPPDFESTKKRALRILGKRNFSEREMEKRLITKGETKEAAEETVRWLVELGYIDDDNYATLIVNHYVAKGYGQARVRDELSRRGIPRDMWDEKIAAYPERGDDGQADIAVEFLRKKLRKSVQYDHDIADDSALPELPHVPASDLRSAEQALIRRGFSYDEARSAVRRYLEEIE